MHNRHISKKKINRQIKKTTIGIVDRMMLWVFGLDCECEGLLSNGVVGALEHLESFVMLASSRCCYCDLLVSTGSIRSCCCLRVLPVGVVSFGVCNHSS